MARFSQVLLLALNALMLTTAVPQYGPPSAGGGGGGAPPPPPPPPPAYAAAPGVAPPSFGGAPSGPPASAGPAPGGSSGGGGAGGPLSVNCQATPDGSGKIKYDCSGVNKDAITLRTEHFLWLESPSSSSQNLDIEIPNYNIDEFIKAAYKALGPQEGAKINILLKKPDITYNAAKEEPPKGEQSQPAVSVNYQPVEKIAVHYPTQKQYQQGTGPTPQAPAPGGPAQGPAPGPAPGAGAYPGGAGGAPGGGAYSRPQRESGYRYYFIRQ